MTQTEYYHFIAPPSRLMGRQHSRFIGVYRNGKGWQARISARGAVCCLGSYSYDEEFAAALARDNAAYYLMKEGVVPPGHYRLNYPEAFADPTKAPKPTLTTNRAICQLAFPPVVRLYRPRRMNHFYRT